MSGTLEKIQEIASGKKTVREAFEDKSASLAGIIIGVIIILFLAFLNAYGAAKLSWHYNMYIGNGSSTAYLWSIVCFFFSGIYYPVYGLFLNPLASMRRNIGVIGGRRS